LENAAIGSAEEISALKLQWNLCKFCCRHYYYYYYYYYYYSSIGGGSGGGGSSSNSSKGTFHPRTVHEGPEMDCR